MNRVTLLGRLGRDPETRSTGSGVVCNLSLATTERYKDKAGAWQEATEWHRVVVFGGSAAACEQHLAKGREVLVEGRLRTRKWTDQNGQERHTTEVVAERVHFVGGKGEPKPATGGGPYGKDHAARYAGVELDDDLPFSRPEAERLAAATHGLRPNLA